MTAPQDAAREAVTPGQAAYEAYVRAVGLDPADWPFDDCVGDIGREGWEDVAKAGHAAIAAQQPPASGDTLGLLEPLHALAAKWDATAARCQRNGQSLIDQGDEYGSEGLVVAEALGACAVDLRAVLADAPEQPAPELAAAMREQLETAFREAADTLANCRHPLPCKFCEQVIAAFMSAADAYAGLTS